MVKYRNNSEVTETVAATRTAITDFGDKTAADVLNLIPPSAPAKSPAAPAPSTSTTAGAWSTGSHWSPPPSRACTYSA